MIQRKITIEDVIFIDNFDSFTYNLTDMFESRGIKVHVFRNDISVDKLQTFVKKFSKDKLLFVLSPGPSAPKDANNLMDIIKTFNGYKMLGICLGHQAIAQYHGAEILPMHQPIHAKATEVENGDYSIFYNIEKPYFVARYHSLYAKIKNTNLIELSRDENGYCMAFTDPNWTVIGLQFHVESLLTTHGSEILDNCLHLLSKTNSTE